MNRNSNDQTKLSTSNQNSFANKVSINPTIFIFVCIGASFVSFLTAAYHTIKVANTNPVDALKYE